jgi:hypothetical protein
MQTDISIADDYTMRAYARKWGHPNVQVAFRELPKGAYSRRRAPYDSLSTSDCLVCGHSGSGPIVRMSERKTPLRAFKVDCRTPRRRFFQLREGLPLVIAHHLGCAGHGSSRCAH